MVASPTSAKSPPEQQPWQHAVVSQTLTRPYVLQPRKVYFARRPGQQSMPWSRDLYVRTMTLPRNTSAIHLQAYLGLSSMTTMKIGKCTSISLSYLVGMSAFESKRGAQSWGYLEEAFTMGKISYDDDQYRCAMMGAWNAESIVQEIINLTGEGHFRWLSSFHGNVDIIPNMLSGLKKRCEYMIVRRWNMFTGKVVSRSFIPYLHKDTNYYSSYLQIV